MAADVDKHLSAGGGALIDLLRATFITTVTAQNALMVRLNERGLDHETSIWDEEMLPRSLITPLSRLANYHRVSKQGDKSRFGSLKKSNFVCFIHSSAVTAMGSLKRTPHVNRRIHD